MTPPGRIARLLLLVAGASAAGCDGDANRETPAPATAQAPVVAPATPSSTTEGEAIRVPEAERRLSLFLDRSLPTVPPDPRMFEGLWSCLPDEAGFEYHWLGDHRIVGSRRVGDTAIVAAELVTVAKQEEDPATRYGWVATARIARDTVEWRMIEDPASGEWVVCGLGSDGVDVSASGTRATIRWQPDGMTMDSVLALVDSLQAAKRRAPP